VGEHGALGDGSPEGRRAAVAVQGLPATPAQLVAGGHTSCVVAAGATWCWGWNPVHDDRDSDDDDPLTSGYAGTVGIAGNPTLLAMGGWGGCAATQPEPQGGGGTPGPNQTGSVDCFGMGVGESLGPDRVEIPEDQRWAWPEPEPPPEEPPTAKLAENAGILSALGASQTDLDQLFGAGGLSSLGTDDGGGLVGGAFGEGPSLGGPAPRAERHGPLHATLKLDLVQLAAGELASCGVDRAGVLRCWGTLDDPDVHQIATGVAHVAVGSELGCFARKAGTVACWTRTTPVADVPGVDRVAEVAVGKDHGCGRRTDGTVVCWGNNAAGAVGPGASRAETPVAVVGLP
jgi:hypothetical protein